MTRPVYRVLIVLTLAIFAVLLIWPGFILRSLSHFTPYSRTEKPASADTVSISGINFDINSTTPDIVPTNSAATSTASVATINRLTVPRMGVNADVVISDSDTALRQGLWHIPGSALPGTNGNIVISAHRWLYKPPNPKTFYLIDTMQVGDPIYYDYHGSRYTYKVTETFIVNPEDVQILRQDKNKLTLFTCTPLYSTKQRLVVTAELVSVTPL